jgi:hypothetical protein
VSLEDCIKLVAGNGYVEWWFLSYHISYHLFSFHKSIQDYIIRMNIEIVIFVGINGKYIHICVCVCVLEAQTTLWSPLFCFL